MAHRRTASRVNVDDDGREPLLLHARAASTEVDASTVASRSLAPLPRRRTVLVVSLVLGTVLWSLFAVVGPDAIATAEDWRDTAMDQAARWRSKWPATAPDRPSRPPTPVLVDTRPWQQQWRDRLSAPVMEDEVGEIMDLRDDLVTIQEVGEHRYTIVWLHVRLLRNVRSAGCRC